MYQKTCEGTCSREEQTGCPRLNSLLEGIAPVTQEAKTNVAERSSEVLRTTGTRFAAQFFKSGWTWRRTQW